VHIPEGYRYIEVHLVSSNDVNTYFDDVRIHPYNSVMKTYAFNKTTQKLMAELDENNYATFYEYDGEGQLSRVKKETIKGVVTLKEVRMNMIKKNQ
jgi:sugar lactone lactonase YvrE